jgi:predicted RNA-binding Zn ribbon-like protein
LLLVKGAIPGSKNGFVRVFLSDKKNTSNSKVTKELSDKLANEAAEAEAAKAAAEAPVEEIAPAEEAAPAEEVAPVDAPKAESADEADEGKDKEAEA